LVSKFVTIVNNYYLSLKLVTIKSFLVVLTVQGSLHSVATVASCRSRGARCSPVSCEKCLVELGSKQKRVRMSGSGDFLLR